MISLKLRVGGWLESARSRNRSYEQPYVNSLSIWSPNPGVSTTVSEMRTPSSSSSAQCGPVSSEPRPRDAHSSHAPTLTGLILMPSSWCAISGATGALCSMTGDSQSVLTKVVRPVPLWPATRGWTEIVSAFRGRTRSGEGSGRTDDHEGESEALLDDLAAAAEGGTGTGHAEDGLLVPRERVLLRQRGERARGEGDARRGGRREGRGCDGSAREVRAAESCSIKLV